VLNNLHLNDLLLDDWHMNLLYHFFNLLHLSDSVDYPLYDLWHFDYLFNDSRHNHYLLHYLLNLHDLRHFHQFLNDFIDWNSHFFYPFDHFRHLHDRLDDNLNWFFHCNVLHYGLLDLNYLNNLDQFLHYLLHLHDLHGFVLFSNHFFNHFFHCHDLLLNHWHLHAVFDNFDYFFDQRDSSLDNSLHFFYAILVDDLLLYYFHLFDCWHFDSALHYFLNDLGHFLYLFDCLDHRNYFLNDSLNDLGNVFDIVDDLSCRLIAHCVHQFLYDFLNLNDHGLFNDPLDDFFYYFFDLLDLFLHLLHDHSFMSDHLNFFYLLNGLVDDLLYNDRLLFFDDFLPNYLNFHDFGDFHSSLHYLFHNFGNFDHFLLDLFHLHYLLHDSVDVLYDFDRNVNDLLHLLDLCVLDNLLHYLLNRHNSGHLNHPLHYLLNDFGHFHYLLIHLENFEDIVD